jgi:hypothetical protein
MRGGLCPAAVKYENGARLGTPSSSRVEQKPIGLGVIPPIMSLSSMHLW